MKKILLISILILIAFSLKATQYYVATTGSNAANGLTVGTAWQTVAYACTTVPAGAHTINIAAGTYNEGTNVMNLKAGVSITGASEITTIILSTYNFATSSATDNNASLRLVSGTPGTNGNQSISYITLDGGDGSYAQGTKAITVYNRSNVKIHHYILKDFYAGGVSFCSSNVYDNSLGAVLETNNELYNGTIDNCTDCSSTYSGYGLMYITCQKDLLIHDNLFYSNKRDRAHNGNIMNAGGLRYNGIKYYNNQSWKPDMTSAWSTTGCGPNGNWNFHLEIWGNDGGFEIYNNTFTGGMIPIDYAGRGATVMTSGHSFDFSIHDNIFRQNNNNYNNLAESAILLEASYIGRTLIYNNNISGFFVGVRVTGFNTQDIKIYDNAFTKIRQALLVNHAPQGPTPYPAIKQCDSLDFYRNKIYVNPGAAYGIDGVIHMAAQNSHDLKNFNIYNNTIVSDNVVAAIGIKILVNSGRTVTNFNIKNNILCYMNNTGTLAYANSGTINGLHYENNFSYNLANANALITYTGTAATSYTATNNLPTANNTQASPLFVNEATQNYNLQAGSPCVNTGQVVSIGGINLPYSGTFPDRGYAEYSTGTTLSTVTLISNTVINSRSLAWDCSTTNAGGGTITERGICWGTSTTPTTATNKIVNGSGLGNYSINITGLLPVTTYYVRAYAINQAGTAYSAEQTASTDAEGTAAISPTVFIDSVNTISINGATVHYQLFDDGGGTISEKGICWNTSPNPTTANSKLTNVQSGISYTTAITTLTANTLYYIRAYAINEGGTGYSSETQITTLASGSVVDPAITMVGLSYVTSRAVSLVGQVTDDGGGNVTERGFCYSLSPNPTTSNIKVVNGSGLGYYNTLMEKLNPTTLYYFCAYAINEAGTSYSSQISVTTSVMKAISSGTGKTIMYKGKIVKY